MPSPEAMSADADPGGPEPVVTCTVCGTVAAGPPLTWMFENDRRRGSMWFCARCARDNLRSAEAKLDQEWW